MAVITMSHPCFAGVGLVAHNVGIAETMSFSVSIDIECHARARTAGLVVPELLPVVTELQNGNLSEKIPL